MKIEDVRTEWLRVPTSPPIADSTHVLRFMDLIVVEVRAGNHSGWSYMLSFDYAPALLKESSIRNSSVMSWVVPQMRSGLFTSRICRRRSISVERASPCGVLQPLI
jgi:hypothetical protein